MSSFSINRKRKTYSFDRSQTPRVASDGVNSDGSIKYYDETQRALNSPFYILDAQPVVTLYGEYDENVINFNGTDSATVTFNIVFSGLPIVTLETLATARYGDVEPYLKTISTSGCTVLLSAPFDGQVVYRAIYAATYPTIVIRRVLSSSYQYYATAGTTNFANTDAGSLSYLALQGGLLPTSLFVTVRDINSNGQLGDVGISEEGALGLVSTTIDFSSPISNQVNYLAVR